MHNPLVVTDATDSIAMPGDFSEVHRNGLIHRAVHIEVVTKEKKYFVWRRPQDGRFEIPGGHVDWLQVENRPETYQEAAARELNEELTVDANWGVMAERAMARLSAHLIRVKRIINQVPSSHGNNNEWVAVFTLEWSLEDWGDPTNWNYSARENSDSGKLPCWLAIPEIARLCQSSPMNVNAALRLFLARRDTLVPLRFKNQPKFGEPD